MFSNSAVAIYTIALSIMTMKSPFAMRYHQNVFHISRISFSRTHLIFLKLHEHLVLGKPRFTRKLTKRWADFYAYLNNSLWSCVNVKVPEVFFPLVLRSVFWWIFHHDLSLQVCRRATHCAHKTMKKQEIAWSGSGICRCRG